MRDPDKIRNISTILASKEKGIPLSRFSVLLKEHELLDKEGVAEVSRFTMLLNNNLKHYRHCKLENWKKLYSTKESAKLLKNELVQLVTS